MGASIDIYYLIRFAAEHARCEHHLLVRARRQSFSNADQQAEDEAEFLVESEREVICGDYARRILPTKCGAVHDRFLMGEMQVFPVGDELFSDVYRERVEVWVADTEYGPPWIAIGTAPSEESFWREVSEEDGGDSVSALNPIRPARRVTVDFYPSGARLGSDGQS